MPRARLLAFPIGGAIALFAVWACSSFETEANPSAPGEAGTPEAGGTPDGGDASANETSTAISLCPEGGVTLLRDTFTRANSADLQGEWAFVDTKVGVTLKVEDGKLVADGLPRDAGGTLESRLLEHHDGVL